MELPLAGIEGSRQGVRVKLKILPGLYLLSAPSPTGRPSAPGKAVNFYFPLLSPLPGRYWQEAVTPQPESLSGGENLAKSLPTRGVSFQACGVNGGVMD